MALSFDPRAVMAPGGIASGLDNLGASIVDVLRMQRQDKLQLAREEREAQRAHTARADDRTFQRENREDQQAHSNEQAKGQREYADMVRKTQQEREDARNLTLDDRYMTDKLMEDYRFNAQLERGDARYEDQQQAQHTGRLDQLGNADLQEIHRLMASVPTHTTVMEQTGVDRDGMPEMTAVKKPRPQSELAADFARVLNGAPLRTKYGTDMRDHLVRPPPTGAPTGAPSGTPPEAATLTLDPTAYTYAVSAMQSLGDNEQRHRLAVTVVAAQKGDPSAIQALHRYLARARDATPGLQVQPSTPTTAPPATAPPARAHGASGYMTEE